MKILVDIGHAGHVHYYKNLMLNEKFKSLEFTVVARNKYPIPELLNSYGIPFIRRSSGRNTKLGKLIYLISGNLFMLRMTWKHKPDVLLSHGGIYTALSSVLLNKPTVTTEDTEGAKLSHMISTRFSNFILTPDIFEKNLGKKQVRFKSYFEYAYLHTNYFKKNHNILKKYELTKEQDYIIVRLVDWTAHHDFDVEKLSYEDKITLVTELAKKKKVILSYESTIPKELKKYAIKIVPEDLHHLLAYASLYVGEGATTASEAAILGTPAIYVNPMQVCYCRDQEENYNLSFNLININEVLNKANELLDFSKEEFVARSNKMQMEKEDTTEVLYRFLSNIKI